MSAKDLKVTVEEFTSPNLITATPDSALDDLKSVMDENNIRHLPIVAGGDLVGLVSQRELKMALSLELNNQLKASDIMIADPICIPSTANLEEAAFEMSKNKIGSLLVLFENDNTYGIFTSTDALNALIEIVRGTDFS